MGRSVIVAAAALCAGSAVRAAKAPEQDRYVFAHYMLCFTQSTEFCKAEIELARRHGIDGFAINTLQWGSVDKDTKQFKPGGSIEMAERMYEAARQLGPDFKLFLSADLNGLGDLPDNMLDMVSRFAAHPNQFRHRGKTVMSGWAGGPESYAGAIARVRARGFGVCFVPYLYSPRYQLVWSVDTCERMMAGHDHIDGIFNFACDDSPWGLMRSNANGMRAAVRQGKLFMAGNCPAYNSANLRDYRGMQGYGAVWEGIIRDGADWVELVTWNDYNEDSHLNAYRWKDGWNRYVSNRDESFLDVTAYYAAAYRSGARPAITQDKLYYVYRNRPRSLTKRWNFRKKAWAGDVADDPDQIHDDVRDRVYVTTFLTAPASLSVRLGGATTARHLPGGISHTEIPLAAGVPRFVLTRDGTTLVDVVGRKEIVESVTKDNSPNGDERAPNRSWTGGAVAGRAIRLEAESGALQEGATVARVGRSHAVRNAETHDSGFVLKVRGLRTGTYAVRVIYSNPTGHEARLTVVADGASRGTVDNPGFEPRPEYPHYIPAFLPPTERGALASTSFLWSLYDTTTFLKVAWLEGEGMDWDRANPRFNDHGIVSIDAVELVEVDPVGEGAPAKREFPEMVQIPGGSFEMGSESGAPDEAPVHRVDISPFAIGRYEVTNAEYESFDPSHRRFRDEYSWRDREPVVQVDWRDAAKYCNWLSQRTGLTPAYREADGQWVLTQGATGFRLPTEAEWEYVASGRGLGRTYPWGEQRPERGVHGNFTREEALDVDFVLRSTEGAGTTVVGSYPAGASRDGVMDLAGNVAEWCSDWRHAYPSRDQTNPYAQTPGQFRVIRGGSWGYYGCSQRCADREFNSQNYPGYVYIGLRVALPQRGWRHLKRTRPGLQ